jgi:leader peptidase (prepilin peptidase) / N-methyltransferase
MNAVFAAASFGPALALGSFLNVVASRLPRGGSLVHPASACDGCGTEIHWYDNIPVVSYLVLHGRCRSCRTPIGWRHPTVEIVTALLLAGCVLAFGLTVEAAAAAVFVAALVVVTATDIERRIVPNRVVLPATVVVLALRLVDHPSVEWPLAGLGAAAFLLTAALAYPGGMGMGDVKLVLLMGVALGRTIPVALFVGMIAALAPAAVLFALHGTAARKIKIPFAPFLAFGGVIGLFAGAHLLDAYLGTLR